MIELDESKNKLDETNNKLDETNNEFSLYFDGCSKGNPGLAGIGAVIYNNGEEYWSLSKYIGNKKTNNEAEYSALLSGLEAAIILDIKDLSVYGDSLLVINQMNGVYKVKDPKLRELYNKIVDIKSFFTRISFTHVYRENNKHADKLANEALDSIFN